MKRLILMLATAAVAWPATYTETISKSSEYIRKGMAEQGVTGMSVALIENQEVVWQQGFGWADRERSLPVSADTTFHIGSVSKMFVSTAIMILVDDGKVELNAPAVRYLPGLRMRSAGYDKITVRMLINHTSGVPGSYFVWGFTTAPVQDYNRRMLDWLPGQYAQYPPAYTTVYTNNGFQLAEEIVATVSGKSYQQFVRDRILEPLGMTHTGVDGSDPAVAAALSKAYTDGVERIPEYVNLAGTGGYTSTPGDLCRFLAMINGGGTAFGRTILKPASVAEMQRDETLSTTARVDESTFTPGLGWDYHADPALAYAGQAPAKDGGTYLFTSQVVTLPAYGLGVAVVSNGMTAITNDAAREILMAALQEAHGIARPADVKVGDPTPAGFELQALTGAYANTKGAIWDLRTNGSTLEVWARSGDAVARLYGPLKHRGEGWFASDADPDTQLAVRRVDNRDVILMRARQGHYWNVGPAAEKLGPAPALSAAWKARLGKVWVAADEGIADYYFSDMTSGIRLMERDGRLTYENLSYLAAGSRTFEPMRRPVKTAATGETVSTSQVIEPVDDSLAKVPLVIACRDLTHLKVIQKGKEEWLQVGFTPTLWRPLDTIPAPEAAKPYTASITPERGEWVKLPAGGAEYVLTAPSSVRWALYDENLQAFFESWGGAWRLGRPAGSKSSTLYLVLYSMTPQQATVQRIEGRTFSSASGVMRIAK